MSKMEDKKESHLAGRQARKEYVPVLKVNRIATFPESAKDPNKLYTSVVTNYKGSQLGNLFQEALDRGWEVVYSTHGLEDDRAFKPEQTDRNDKVATAVIHHTSDGFEEVLMCIDKDRYQQNQKEQNIRDRQRYLAAVGKDPETGKPASTMNRAADGLIHENINGGEFHINLNK